MTPAEERALIDELSEAARETESGMLVDLLLSHVRHCEFIHAVGADLSQIGEEAQIEFTILRNELESRGIVRFH